MSIQCWGNDFSEAKFNQNIQSFAIYQFMKKQQSAIDELRKNQQLEIDRLEARIQLLEQHNQNSQPENSPGRMSLADRRKLMEQNNNNQNSHP